MALLDTIAAKHTLGDPDLPARKRFKTSELPLSSSQRSSIDGLLHTMKKKGEYDTLRKQVWSQFAESEEKAAFTKSLNELAEAEIDRDPSLLSRDRGKASTLMQGAVDRSDIYKNVEKALDDLIAKNVDHIIKAGREIRKAEVGEEVAAEEEKRGSKTDEEYANEAAVRRQERARARKQEEARKRREDEKDALRAEEAKKMKELEKLRSQDEKRKEREALRAVRGGGRRREMPKDGFEGEKYKMQDIRAESPITAVPPVDEKALEEAALALLLQEGREAAAKNAPKVERERSESPHRKPHVSPPKGPAAMRVRDPTNQRLSFSSVPVHQGSPIPPPPPSVHSRSRSPYRASSSRRDRSHSGSRARHRSNSIREDEPRREVESEAQTAFKAQMRAKRYAEAEAYRSRDEGGRRERSESRATERDSTRDRDDRGKRYDYDYKSSHDNRYRDERHRSRDRERSRYQDRSSYTRPPREEAPEHIDRYVPGGARPARDRETGDRETRDRDTSGRDTPREPRRASYYDTDRERQYYKKDSEGGKSEYRDKERGSDRPRDRDRDRDHGYRGRDRRDDRSYVRPRTDDPPEHIDRYVPGK